MALDFEQKETGNSVVLPPVESFSSSSTDCCTTAQKHRSLHLQQQHQLHQQHSSSHVPQTSVQLMTRGTDRIKGYSSRRRNSEPAALGVSQRILIHNSVLEPVPLTPPAADSTRIRFLPQHRLIFSSSFKSQLEKMSSYTRHDSYLCDPVIKKFNPCLIDGDNNPSESTAQLLIETDWHLVRRERE